MKSIITALIALSIAFTTRSYAQSIPNASFENWTPVLSSLLEPDHWFATGATKGTPGYIGSYFLNLTNTPTDLAVAMTTSNYDYINDTGSAGFACPYKPACLSGSYQYNITGSDSAIIEVLLYRGYRSTYGGGSSTMCGLGMLFITAGSVGTWTDFSVPVTYFPPYDTPDSANILLSASINQNTANRVAGNFLYIDNLHFCTSSEVNNVSQSQPLEIYPNPVVNELNIKGDMPADATIKICNYLGQTVFEGKGAHTVDIRNMPAGVYWVNIFGSNNEVLKRTQIVKE